MYWTRDNDKVFSSLVTNNGVKKYCEIYKLSDSYEIKISKTGDSIINFTTILKEMSDIIKKYILDFDVNYYEQKDIVDFEINTANNNNVLAEYTRNDKGIITTKKWKINGLFSRKDKPAIIVYDDDGNIIKEMYYQNGILNRYDGPAVVKYHGDEITELYYISYKKYTKGHFDKTIKMVKKGTIVNYLVNKTTSLDEIVRVKDIASFYGNQEVIDACDERLSMIKITNTLSK